MKNKILLLALLFLSACATDQPVIKTVVQKVEVPISVPCKTDIPTQPDFNFNKLTVEDPLFDKTKSLLADRKLSAAYQQELLAALQSCK